MLPRHFFSFVFKSVDTLNEAIKLEKYDTIQAKQFQSFVPRQKARYHFYVYEHNFDGNLIQSTLFLYTLPPSGHCPVKEKMLYSSCKAPFLDTVQRHVGLQIDRKVLFFFRNFLFLEIFLIDTNFSSKLTAAMI